MENLILGGGKGGPLHRNMARPDAGCVKLLGFLSQDARRHVKNGETTTIALRSLEEFFTNRETATLHQPRDELDGNKVQ